MTIGQLANMELVGLIRRRSDLAATYAGDGGWHSAAGILRDLASQVDAMAHGKDDDLRAFLKQDPARRETSRTASEVMVAAQATRNAG
jgi:hypothetical protein